MRETGTEEGEQDIGVKSQDQIIHCRVEVFFCTGGNQQHDGRGLQSGAEHEVDSVRRVSPVALLEIPVYEHINGNQAIQGQREAEGSTEDPLGIQDQ